MEHNWFPLEFPLELHLPIDCNVKYFFLDKNVSLNSTSFNLSTVSCCSPSPLYPAELYLNVWLNVGLRGKVSGFLALKIDLDGHDCHCPQLESLSAPCLPRM